MNIFASSGRTPALMAYTQKKIYMRIYTCGRWCWTCQLNGKVKIRVILIKFISYKKRNDVGCCYLLLPLFKAVYCAPLKITFNFYPCEFYSLGFYVLMPIYWPSSCLIFPLRVLNGLKGNLTEDILLFNLNKQTPIDVSPVIGWWLGFVAL